MFCNYYKQTGNPEKFIQLLFWTSKNFAACLIPIPVRRLVWRCTSEPERDKSVFGVASMSRPSGFRGNEIGYARANVQSPHLRLL